MLARHARRGLPLLALLVLIPAVGAEEPATPASESARRLIAEEQARSVFERALELSLRPAPDATQRAVNQREAVRMMLDHGPEMIPVLIGELERKQPETFYLAAYGLGRFATDEARAALKEAIRVADAESSQFAGNRKGWAGVYLAMAGGPEAIEGIATGAHKSAAVPVFKRGSALEIAALFLGPAARPPLEKLLTSIDDPQDPLYSTRSLVVVSLGRVGDRESVKTLDRLLREPNHPTIRKKAATALRYARVDGVAPILVRAAADDDLNVRRQAAESLSSVGAPADQLPKVLALLNDEPDPIVRSGLYFAAARIGGTDAVPGLCGQWGRSDARDRAALMRALGTSPSAAAMPTLRLALDDPSPSVVIPAVRAVGALGSPEAIALLERTVERPPWAAAQSAMQELVRLGATGSAPVLHRRLVERELAGVVTDPTVRLRALMLCQALVDLRYADGLDALRAAAARQVDPTLTSGLDRSIGLRELLRDRGDDAKAWAALLDDDDPELRALAYRALERIGDPALAAPLIERFGRVDVADGVEILTALGRLDGPETRDLLRRVIVAPSFDRVPFWPLRDAAAWSARRLGGEDMVQALIEGCRRRHGIDVRPLIYLSMLAPERGPALIEELRVPRTIRLESPRGDELLALDLIWHEARANRVAREFDVPPDRLDFR